MGGRLFHKFATPILIFFIIILQPVQLGSGIHAANLLEKPKDLYELNADLAGSGFLADSFDDFAVGIYLEDIAGNFDCGAAHVFYGRDLPPYRSNFVDSWSQDPSSIEDLSEDNDHFGFALSAGDFNRDSFQDLAIGVPLEDLNLWGEMEVDAGAVHILYGNRDEISDDGDRFLRQEFYGYRSEAHEYFGFSLASGDFNGDGYDDLVVGSPGETVESEIEAGMITVIYGSSDGLTTASKIQEIHQNLIGVSDGAQAHDQFGYSLAVGDFNADQYDDLVIGIPYEDVSGEDQGSTMLDAGAVNILYGSWPDGLSTTKAQFLHQNSPNVNDSSEPNDHFGWSLATGWLNNDQYDDLAIGIPQESFGEISQAGAVSVLFGFSPGIVTLADQIWHQDVPGLLGDGSEELDRFGWSLTAGDFDMNGIDDLAIGVPMEDISDKEDAGVVHVIYSKGTGPHYDGNQVWHHDRPNISGKPAENHDNFGFALAAGDLNGDSFNELLIGNPGDEIDSIKGAGSVNILLGSDFGVTDRWDSLVKPLDFLPIPWTAPGVNDYFGSSLVILPAPHIRTVYVPIMVNSLAPFDE